MRQKCSKCGVETDYGGDLHCRNIFIEEINRLLLLKELDKAKGLYFSASFDADWKEHFLCAKGGDLWRLIENERKLLLSKIRAKYCYICKKPLDKLNNIKCRNCGWLKCSCGACGCEYKGEKFNNEDV